MQQRSTYGARLARSVTGRDETARHGRWRLEATVRGRVQGVGFRRYVHTWARRLALGGWVRNEPDGTVTLCAEGDAEAAERLARLLWGGSPVARVDAVEARWTELRNPAPPDPTFVVERTRAR